MAKYSIRFMSDAEILRKSSGEVTSSSLFDHKRDRPSFGGLLCERIFGPLRHLKCSCGQLRGLANMGKRCNTCHVECLPSNVRNERSGHIHLAGRYVNPLMYRTVATLMGLSKSTLLSILNLQSSVKLVRVDYPLQDGEAMHGTLIGKDQFEHALVTKPLPSDFLDFADEVISGSVALYNCAIQLDTFQSLKLGAEDWDSVVHKKYLELKDFELSDFFQSEVYVKPVTLRPISIGDDNTVQAGFNELYLKILRANFQLKTALDNYVDHPNIPKMIMGHSRLLEQFISDMQDQGNCTRTGNHIPGVISTLRDKDGLVRGELLGKRVDFSGRSAITTNPMLKINEVGVPRKMMRELLTPHIIGHLCDHYGYTLKGATALVKRSKKNAQSVHWAVDAALDAIVNHPTHWPVVMLNRAPSLHRYSVQACKPVMHEGKSLQLPSHVCSGYNADHDGDTMAIHLILSDEARAEALALLSQEENLLTSRTGAANYSLNHEQVVGIYFLTYTPDHQTGNERPIMATSIDDAITQWESQNSRDVVIGREKSGWEIQHPVMIRAGRGDFVKSSVGRCLVARTLRQDIEWLRATGNDGWDKGRIGKELVKMIKSEKFSKAECLDIISDFGKLGFEWSTKMGLSIAYDDTLAPSTFQSRIESGDEFEKEHPGEAGLRHWAKVSDELVEDWLGETTDKNPLKFMYATKARVSSTQVRQMNILKGLIADPSGGLVLVKNSLSTGLTPWEYLLTCKGSRMSLGANHEIVPQSGYLCRQLVNAGRELIIKVDGPSKNTESGIHLPAKDAIGRYEVGTNRLITEENYTEKEEWEVQSSLTSYGAVTTYECGIDPSTNKLHTVNTHIGVIAGQTAAECTTQLSLRQKHLSGAVDVDATTSRVTIARESGTVTSITDKGTIREIVIKGENELKYLTFNVECDTKGLVVGSNVEAGEVIAEYDVGLQDADISATLSQIIKLVGASNPGKAFRHPIAVTSHVSGKIRYHVETFADGYDYNSDLMAMHDSIDTTPALPDGELIKSENRTLIKPEEFKYGIVHIYVDDVFVGTVDSPNAIIYPEGTEVRSGDKLSYGLADIATIYQYSNKDMQLTWRVFYNEIKSLYGSSGITIAPIHYETLLRAKMELVWVDDDYRLREDYPNVKPELLTITQCILKYPSLFKTMNFGYIRKQIEKFVEIPSVTTDCSSERLIQGLPIRSPQEFRAPETMLKKSNV